MSNLFAELKRRNVVRVAIAYAVAGGLIIEVMDTIAPRLGMPDWVPTFFIVAVLIGLPIALFFSWSYEITPEGVKKTEEVDQSQSLTHSAGRKLDRVIIVLLVVVLGYFVWDKFGEMSSQTLESEIQPVAMAEKSIAVLPFANMSGDAQNAQFTDGLHDDLLTQLAKIRDLKVISRTSVLEYRNTTKNMRVIGQELGVAAIMEGGVQRAGSRVRINVQLIDAGTNAHLWAETYDRELSLENIFDIQSEIARNIATALKATLGEETLEAGIAAPTQSLAAYESYLRGRLALETTDFSMRSLSGVRGHYLAAIAEDPDFALAYAALAEVNDRIYWWVDRSDENRAAILEAAEKAIELAPELPEAHFAMARYYYHGLLDYDRALTELALAEDGMAGTSSFHQVRAAIYRRSGNFEAAASDFEKAADLNPKNALAQFAAIATLNALRRFAKADARAARLPDTPEYRIVYALRKPLNIDSRSGDPGPALQIFDRLQDRDFGFFVSPGDYFILLLEARRYDDALALLERDIWIPWRDFGSLFPKDYYRALAVFATAPDAARTPLERALAAFDARLEVAPENWRLLVGKGVTLAHLGRHDEAIAHVRRAMEILPLKRDAFAGTYPIRSMATVLAIASRYEEALEVLDRYLSLPAAVSLRNFMNSRPGVKGLENHAGFAALVEKHGWVQKETSRQ